MMLWHISDCAADQKEEGCRHHHQHCHRCPHFHPHRSTSFACLPSLGLCAVQSLQEWIGLCWWWCCCYHRHFHAPCRVEREVDVSGCVLPSLASQAAGELPHFRHFHLRCRCPPDLSAVHSSWPSLRVSCGLLSGLEVPNNTKCKVRELIRLSFGPRATHTTMTDLPTWSCRRRICSCENTRVL